MDQYALLQCFWVWKNIMSRSWHIAFSNALYAQPNVHKMAFFGGVICDGVTPMEETKKALPT